MGPQMSGEKYARLALAGVLVLSLTACGTRQGAPASEKKGQSAPGPATGEELKIGWMGGLTGMLAELGLNTKEATDWAVDEANQKGGVLGRRIKLVYADTKIDPQLARQSVERLIKSDRVAAIIGDYYTPNTDAAMEIAARFQVPMITPGSSGINLTTKGNQFIFRGCYSSAYDATVMGQYAINTLGLKTFAIFGGTDSFSRSVGDAFADYVKRSGKGEVVGYESYDRATTKDFTNLLLKYRGKPPDAVYLAGAQADGGLIAKQAAELGLKVRLLGNLAQTKDAYFKIGGPATVGTVATTSFAGMAENYKDFAEPSTIAFTEAFTRKFGKPPTLDHAQGYDATGMLLEALRRANSTDGEKVRQALLSLDNYKGAVGTIKMLPNGDIQVRMNLVQLQADGKWKVLASSLPSGQ